MRFGRFVTLQHILEERAADISMRKRILGNRSVDGSISYGLKRDWISVDANEVKLFQIRILVTLRQQPRGCYGWIVSRGNDPVDFVTARSNRALDLCASDALLGHVCDRLNDVDVRMLRHDLLNTVIAQFGIHVGDGFKNVEDIALVSHDFNQILGRSHRRTFDIGSDRKRNRCRCMWLPAISHHENMMPDQGTRQTGCPGRVAWEKADRFIASSRLLLAILGFTCLSPFPSNRDVDLNAKIFCGG